MTVSKSTTASPRFIHALRNAGIEPGDSAELRLSKSLLMFTTGLFTLTTMLWVVIYSFLGQQFSTTLPLVFQMLLVGNMLVYLRSNDFEVFRISQLGLFLFLPFVAQWAAGNFITSSGVILWALLAPVGALLCIGTSESGGWFIAWVALTAISSAIDYYLLDPVLTTKHPIDLRTSVAFFALNFIMVSSAIYLLLRYAFLEKRAIQGKLEKAHAQIQIEQQRAEKLSQVQKLL